MANGGRIDYTVGFKADLSGLNSVRNGLKEIQNLTAQDYMIRFSTTNSLQQAERELETLKAQVAQIEVAYTKSFDSKLGVLNVQALDKEWSKAGIRTQNLFNTLAKVGQENVFNKMIEQATTANYKLKQTKDGVVIALSSLKMLVQLGLDIGEELIIGKSGWDVEDSIEIYDDYREWVMGKKKIFEELNPLFDAILDFCDSGDSERR